MSIQNEFFENYAGSGKPYSKVWRSYCYFDECCDLFKKRGAPPIRSICVLGSASGEILEGFEKKLGIRPFACEVNREAYLKTPAKYRRKVKCLDMRDFVREVRQEGRVFSLCFSNSFIYLPERGVSSFLKDLARVAQFVHFRSSFEGSACPDPWRKTLKPFSWWNEQLEKAGFESVTDGSGRRTYLWRSRCV